VLLFHSGDMSIPPVLNVELELPKIHVLEHVAVGSASEHIPARLFHCLNRFDFHGPERFTSN
jgi:hypothetical protein